MLKRRNCNAGVRLMILAAGCALVGCAGHQKQSEGLANAYQRGDMEVAVAEANKQAQKHGGDEANRVVWWLEQGRVLQVAGEVDESIVAYGRAEEELRPYLDVKADAKISEGISTTVINQSLSIYRGTAADRVMLSTMQAVNYLCQEDWENAGVELQRAYEWQDDAVQKNAARIERNQESLDKLGADKGIPLTAILDNPETRSALNQLKTAIPSQGGYGAFVNPFTTYLSGLHLLSRGNLTDASEARTILMKAAGVVDESAARKLIMKDIRMAEKIMEEEAAEPITYVFFLAGMAPHLEELRVDIPVGVPDLPYVAVAFPQLVLSNEALPDLSVVGDGGELHASHLLCDMDKLVAREFYDRFPSIVAQEILGATIKAIATHAASKENGLLGGIGGSLFQAATTGADTRSWRTLPKQIRFIRLATPESGGLILAANGIQIPLEVELGKTNFIFVTMPSLDSGVRIMQCAR